MITLPFAFYLPVALFACAMGFIGYLLGEIADLLCDWADRLLDWIERRTS